MAAVNAESAGASTPDLLVAEKPSWVKDLNRWAHSVYVLLGKWIIAPLIGAAIAALLISRLINAFIGVDHYSVYVVGPSDQPALADAFTKFANTPVHWSIQGIPVRLKVQDDQGEPDFAARIAAGLSKRDDTLLVIGHFQSSSSKAALPLYMDADPPIPVILTTETTANILPAANRPHTYYPVLWLSPDDDSEVRAAFDFARGKGAKAFWIVQDDLANPVYSSYLAEKFMERAQSPVTQVLLQTSPTLVLSPSVVKHLKTDWIFFAGGWRAALLFIRQLHAAGFTGMHILMSDGCATQDLLDAASTGELDGIYVAHSLFAKTFSDSHYGAYADDSIALVDKLISDADAGLSDGSAVPEGLGYRIRRMAGVHRVQDSRNAVIQAIHSVSGEKVNLPHGPATFEKNGARRAKFHIWQIVNGKFVDAS